MKIQPNSRQVPKDIEFTSSKDYYDILYVHLQVISDWDETNNVRYLNLPRINYSELGRAIGVSRQTAARKFHGLEHMDLLKYNEELSRWELPKLD